MSGGINIVGTPNVMVKLKKVSQQYICPKTDFDMSINDFYQDYSSPNIKSDNVYFDSDLGLAMVQPIFANRNNFVEGTFSGKYFSEHPVSKMSESFTEIQRRVFIPKPTPMQYYISVVGTMGDDKRKLFYADYMQPGQKWGKSWAYNGPLWSSEPREPSGEGAKQATYWIHQNNAMPNVEWMLQQRTANFTNQSCWIEVHKYLQLPMQVKDAANTSRYHAYGGREVGNYFAVRLGWHTPKFGSGNYPYPQNTGTYAGFGPYDIVFPIDGTPFIWDFGSTNEPKSLENGLSNYSSWNHPGFMSSQQSSEEWVLSDTMSKFVLYFYILDGRLAVKTSYCSSVWLFPTNSESVKTRQTKAKYNQFFMPPSFVCIHGRGFKFSMSYNPLEFNVYNADGQIKRPTAKLVSKAINERKNFSGGSKSGGWLDMYSYLGTAPESELGKDQNFLCVPMGEITSGVEAGSSPLRLCYGGDILMDTPPGMNTKGGDGRCTSMMIPIAGGNPHGSEFANSTSSVFCTKMRVPSTNDPESTSTNITSFGFETTLTQVWNNKILEVYLNSKAPTECLYCGATSLRFASPVFKRVKGKHFVPPTDYGDEITLNGIIKSVSYDSQGANLSEVRSTYRVEVLIPKPNQYAAYQSKFNLPGRNTLLGWLTNGSREVEIYLGYSGGSVTDPAILDGANGGTPLQGSGYAIIKVFTGLTVGSPIKQTYTEDTVTLECKDKIQMLEDYPILNSPFYDGMDVKTTFEHLGTLGGLPQKLFYTRSRTAHEEVLGMSFSFLQPAFKFDDNTPLYDAMKTIATRIQHVIRCDVNGDICLTELNFGLGGSDGNLADRLDDLDNSHESYVFYVDGSKSSSFSPFQIIYDSVSVNRNMLEKFSNIELHATDTQHQGQQYVQTFDQTSWDIGSVEDPNSPNFIGYRKPYRYNQPAIGTKEESRNMVRKFSNHVYEPPIQITFTTVGRPTLRPYDIIQVSFEADTNFYFYVTSSGGSWSPTNIIKFRVLSISGKLAIENGGMMYSMSVTAERK